MNKKFSGLMGMGVALVILLAACQATAIEPTIDLQGLVSTSVAQTLAANASNPTANQLPTSSFPTATLMPSATQIPTLPVLPTSQPIVATSVPCLHMNFIKDVTVPDNTSMAPGTSFTKTWKLYNDGSCTWSKSFILFFFSGDQLSAPAAVSLPNDVLSGQQVDVSVNMVAPTTEGTYTSNWKMKSPDGTIFGSGNTSIPIWTKIIVSNVAFAVTGVAISVDNATPSSNPCTDGHKFTFTASITVTAPGKVTYYWKFSDGATTSPNTLDFTGPGTKSITTSWTLNTNLVGSVSVYIDNPNHQFFGPGGTFTYICTP